MPRSRHRRRLVEFMERLESRQLLTTYYVSPSGNDAHSGTSTGSAWRSVGKCDQHSFKAGDQILFQGGSSFSGTLYLTTDDKGTASSPIKIGSYGNGRATLTGGTTSGLYVYNTAGISISNLNFSGSGYSSNTGGGIYFYTDLANNVKLPYVHITSVDVHGYKNGIEIGGGNGASGFKDVQITSSTIHDNKNAGIFTFAPGNNVHQGVYIGHCKAWNNVGISGDTGVSGHGFILGGVNGGTIERSVAHNNGALGNGGAGMWAYNSTKITFQYNESYNNKTGGPHDGDGFDFDQNTSYSVMQYNYSHGNDGAGFLMATKYNNTTHTGCIIRYNITQNDCRKLNYGALHIWGRVNHAEWYNNTVYLPPSASGSTSRYGIKIVNDAITTQYLSSVHFRNNIIQTKSGIPLLWIESTQLKGATDLKFQGNCWYSSGSSFKIIWGSTTYSSLSSWRSAKGQEKNGSTSVGYSGDPKLTTPSSSVTFDNADKLSNLTSCKLQSSSPLINTALTLSTFGINAGSRDFWGTSLPKGGKYDYGADEYG